MGSEKRARQKAGRQQRLEEQQRTEERDRRRSVIIRLSVLAVVVVALIGLYWAITRDGGGDSNDEVATEETATATPDTSTPPSDPEFTPYTADEYGTGECAPVEGVDEPVTEFDDAPQLCIEPGGDQFAVFETTAGQIVVQLDTTNTPGTANNFVNLARFGYYDDTLVHRSDPGIGILQGGSPTTNNASDPGPGYTIFDEGTGFSYRPGQLVMARTAAPDSAGAQYFFTVTDSAAGLNAQGTFVVFGEVLEGQDVLDAVLASHVDDPENQLGGSPDPEVTVLSVTISEAAPAAAAGAESP